MTDYRITFRAMPSTVPAINRLRRLLKLALRYLRLSAVNVEAGVDGVFPRPAHPEARSGGKPTRTVRRSVSAESTKQANKALKRWQRYKTRSD